MEYKGPSVERYSLYSPFCRSLPPSAPSPRTATSSDSGFASPAVSIPPHIYLLQVDGPESLCLRPELTPSLSRMLQREQHQHPSGIARRWYSIERVWRHEKPGCGRRREHFQWNLDIALPSLPTRNTFTAPDTADAAQQTQGRQNNQKRQNMGSPATGFSSFAAAELIAAAVRLFQKLGLSSRDVRIRVGSRSLLRDLLWTEEELRSPETSVPLSSTAKEDRTPDNGTLLSGTTPHFFSTHDECIFRQRLTTAMQILDRASRQSREETEIALANGLGITVEKSHRILQRLISFDVNNESMVRELGRKLQRLGKGDGTQQGDGSRLDHTGSERPSDGTGVLSSWLPTSVKDLQSVLHLLREGYGIGDWVDVDLLIVRGLHYYTGVVFEAFDSEGVFRAILGGGCYGEPGASVAVMETTAEGPSVSTESPEVPTMHLKPHKSSNRRNMRSGVSGVGLGMGDCVLIELLQRKGLLPIPGSTIDIIVAPRQNSAAQDPPREVPAVSPSGASNGNQRLPVMDESRDKLRYSTPSATSVSNWHSVAAEQLCCKLRALGLRVELLLPPHRSERAAIKHARSVGAKAVIFVAPRVQLQVLEVDASIPDSAAEVPPSLFSGAKEMRNPTEFKVLLIPEENQNSTPLSKQQQKSQPGDLHPIRCTSGSLKHAGTLTTIPSVVEMLEANLRLSSQDRQP
ncbi:histidyl-tRNA synthetase, putative [Eimeria mitis]|uniref:histidine--tRNA ligase n=1 Tax=Eimeria mitis TaxID=44415 RepID=U6KBX0_9EIME|nr:histidyl-tRNA synthetase, putative [Eimeria mitis]CDJ32968.1 histidyl-tRNA synthetase, putative [Eimeria mitis]